MMLRRLTISFAGVVVLLGLTPSMAQATQEEKVVLCHVPPGNPDNAHTIEVAQPAADAHLANHDGDYLGECKVPDPDPEPTCDESPQVYFEPNTKLKDTWTRQGNDFISKVYISTKDGLPACDPEQFVLSSWNTEGGNPPPVNSQTLAGKDTLSTRDAGTYVLRVPIPECGWQVDFAPGLTEGQGNELAYSWGDGPKSCDEDDEPKPPKDDKPDKPKHDTVILTNEGQNKHERYGGTAMTGTREEVIRWGLFLIVALLVIAGSSLAARKRFE